MPILEPDINHSAAYGYDRLNRLQVGLSDQNNNETGIAYDLMGNLTSLKRYTTNTLTDQLTYTYTGNQLSNVADATASNTGLPAGTTNYTYDGNGNMLTQSNTVNTASNKTVTYNLLNLPQSITIPNGTVTYTYDATGQKLRKVAVINGITTTTEYIAGIQYKNSTTAVDFIQTEEGRAAPNGTGYDYIYYLGDNLGNTRRTFGTKTGSAVLYQSDDYLPFGLEINNSVSSPKNEYLYNKKELQEELGEYDYGARFYDPVIGRWNVIDPLAEISRRWSPYNYVENDPIRNTDPDGMSLPGLGPDANGDESPDQLKEKGAEFEKMSDIRAGITKALTKGPGDKKGGGGPKVVPGPNGKGPNDKINMSYNPNTETISKSIGGVTIRGDFGIFGLENNPTMKDNPYAFSNKEVDDYAWNEFGIVAGEAGGELIGPAARGIGRMFRGVGAAGAVEEGGSYLVYHGLDNEGVVKYIGITSRDAGLRFAEHLNSFGTGRELLDYRVVEGATGLSKIGARIQEQTLINQYGLENLLNKINSIAPKNWSTYGITP